MTENNSKGSSGPTELDWPRLLDDCVDFTQRLIRTPSMSFQEAEIAGLIAQELRDLQFDEVAVDEAGNVIGRIRGQEPDLPALVLNTHLDHVDPGELDLWPVPPYESVIRDGRIVGRGACDIKGPLAVQVYAMAALRRSGQLPRRDVVFSGVVQEEIGGAGAQYWVEHLDYPVALVVLGEPSANEIALGHRGLVQMWVTFHGRSVHASAPERGLNPNYALGEFLSSLQSAAAGLSAHPLLGPTTVAPTIIEVDTTSSNVTPAWTRVLLDFRTASESKQSLLAFVERLAAGHTITITDAWCSEPTPLEPDSQTIFGYDTSADSEVVQRALAAITAGMGRQPKLISYQFATDGRHFAPHNIPVIGYAPGEEDQAHTAGESISIAQMEEALRGYVQLLRQF